MRDVQVLGVVLLLGLLPPIALWLNEPFYVNLFARILIYALAALSLDLILGYGGMVSLGHAAFLGFGAYSVGILAHHGVDSGWVSWPLAVGGSALLALLLGALSLRTQGIYFIMITLAFAQMLYYVAVNLSAYGGEDGMPLWQRSDFGVMDLSSDTQFYYLVWGILLLTLFAGQRLVRSRFGLTLRGIHANPRRMRAIGYPVFRYQLVAYVIAGALCGLAGVLLANQAYYVSPSYLHWSLSGHLIVMVVLGGMATLWGPIAGAIVFLLAEELLAGVTDHWMVILGPLLLLVVLFGRGGIAGGVNAGLSRWGGRHG